MQPNPCPISYIEFKLKFDLFTSLAPLPTTSHFFSSHSFLFPLDSLFYFVFLFLVM